MLSGTLAESLFAGSNEASKALSSARFILSDKLSEHVTMADGRFSIRPWLEDANGGNLFITWREDMSEALKPLRRRQAPRPPRYQTLQNPQSGFEETRV